MPTKPVRFADCELDLAAFELRRDGKTCPIEPQVFELLAFLLQNPGRLITKDELIAGVWGGRIVSDSALASRIKSARRAIGDDGEQQRFIRTVHGRGIRFVGELTPDDGAVAAPPPPASPAPEPLPASDPPRAVGRETEIGQLRALLTTALAQRRQTVFVAGEAGLGKTTLIEAFAHIAESELGCRVGYGQCLPHRGVGEAYMPVLEALGRLGQRRDGQPLVALLRDRAPSWLLQMPWLLPAAEQEQLRRQAASNARERMLREIVEAIEMSTSGKPLLLVLEDLQWSDPSTIDLIARLAQRREPARLMIIGSYRPMEIAAGDHPLRGSLRELHGRGLCSELALPLLSEAAVGDYVASRFPSHDLPGAVATTLYNRTDGNPLFMSNVIDSWIVRRLLVERDGHWTLNAPAAELEVGVPDSLRRVIEQNLDGLDSDSRAMLEAAAVAGREFPTAAVANAAERAEEEVDQTMMTLARQGFLLRALDPTEWPDGTVTSRYAFLHDLYREVLYDRIPGSRRVQLHRRVAARLETGYAMRAPQHAAELVSHFSLGRKATRTIRFARLAADQVLRRGGHGEAIGYINIGLAMLERIEDDDERRRLEFGLQITRGTASIAAEGYAADSTEQAYRRARALSAGRPCDGGHFPAAYGLFLVSWNRARLREADELAREMKQEADAVQDPVAQCVAYRAVAVAANALGDFARAYDHGLQAVAFHEPERDRDSALEYAQDIGVGALVHRGIAEWHLGRTTESADSIETALRRARHLGHANTVAYGLYFSVYMHLLARQGAPAIPLAGELVSFADERFMGYWGAAGRCVLGAAQVLTGDFAGGREKLRDGLQRWNTAQIQVFRPTFLGFLAEAESGLGEAAAAEAALREACAAMQQTRECWYGAPLSRLSGTTPRRPLGNC